MPKPAGTPSVMVDAIAVILWEEGRDLLLREAAAVQPCATRPESSPTRATGLGEDFVAAAGRRYWAREPGVRLPA